MPLRIAAVDDDDRYRASLELLLGQSPGFVFGGGYASPEPILQELEDAHREGRDPGWDVVLMDVDLPGMNGVECTRRIKALLPDLPVVVLTVFEDRNTVLNAICAGADGYLVKRSSGSALLEELQAVLAGGSPLSAGVARTVLDLGRRLPLPPLPGQAASPGSPGAAVGLLELTERESEVLGCLVQGMSYKRVGHTLGIQVDTVRTHIRSIYRKLQVHTVAEAVGRALWEGLV